MVVKRFREEENHNNDNNTVLHLSHGGVVLTDSARSPVSDTTTTHSWDRVFECKTCNRQFPSFQALGGHRASHKKPRLVEGEDGNNQETKHRNHKCAICGEEYSAGQALGGHMRKHRNMAKEEQEGPRTPTPVDKLKDWSNSKRNNTGFSVGMGKGIDFNLIPIRSKGELRELDLLGSFVH